MSVALSLDSLSGVSETLLIPFFCRYWESRNPQTRFQDPEAEAIGDLLLPLLAESSHRFHQDIVQRRWPKPLQVSLALRCQHFDSLTQHFLAAHGERAQVVLLACGLDSRYQRLGRPEVDWVELDLPDVMALRGQLFQPQSRVRNLACSVLDPVWMQQLDPQRPTLIQAEGLLMYLPRQQIRQLFRDCAAYFTQAELAVEVVAHWLAEQLSQGVLQGWFQGRFHLKGTTFQGGLVSAREPESWHAAIRLLQQWSFFDEQEPRLSLLNLLRTTPLREMQSVVRYRLEA